MKLPSLRTMVAEDDVALARLLVDHLEVLGLTVAGQAHDGEEAVLLARSLEPDLVILDLKMPKRNGLQVAQEILSERFIPVILLTGHVEAAFVEKAAELGVMGYLTKPFDQRSLYASISVALAQHAQIRTLQEEAGSLREALETRKLVERAKGILMDRFGLDEEAAMRRLREESRNRNLKLGEVARSLIQAHETLTKVGGSPRQPKS
jgi:response regulator NasT